MILFNKYFARGRFYIEDQRPSNTIILKQVHGKQVHCLSQCHPEEQLEGDGIYWHWDHQNKFGACIMTADCVPVLILGEKGGALLHAGWKGIKEEIILQGEIRGLKPLFIFLGPSILWNSYPVGEEFYEYFPNSEALIKKDDQLYFSLQKQIQNQVELNYPTAIFEDGQICTFKNKQYNSYRREKLIKRNWNIFKIN